MHGPNLPTLADLKNHLREEPLYLQVLENYLRNAARLINDLRARLEAREDEAREVRKADSICRASLPPTQEQLEHEHDLERDRENEDQLVHHLLEEEQQQAELQQQLKEDEPVPALVFDQGSLEEEEMAEWRQVSHELSLDEGSFDVVSRARAGVPERRKVDGIREIILRSRTIRIPIVEEVEEKCDTTSASSEAFHTPVVEGLPPQYQQLMVAPKIDPYTVTRNADGSITIACSMCPKKFGTLKGWRIHASRMHKENGFCQKCGHFISMPHVKTAEEIIAMIELHSLEWCPKAAKAIISERAVKRRRLELAGRNDEAQHYYIPGAQEE